MIAEGTSHQLKSNIGNERLELHLASDIDLLKTKELLTKEALRFEEENVVTIAVDGSIRHVKDILSALDSHSINVKTFLLHKPTLDDVFLQLTGRHAEVVNGEEKK